MRNRGIATQIVALVAVAIFLASAIMLGVTFRGPPPLARPVMIDEIAAVLSGARAPPQDLDLTVEARPPALVDRLRAQPALSAQLRGRLRDARALVIADDQRQGPGAPVGAVLPALAAAAPLGDQWRVVRADAPPLLTQWHYVTFGSLTLILLLLIGAASVIARTIARPLRHLVLAAEGTTATGSGPPLPNAGPIEVVQTAAAVAAMRGRLSAAIDERTALLLGMAHDLGTPLNRLAFRMQGLEDEARTAAQIEIDGMRRMLARILDYARDGVDAPLAAVDLAAVVQKAAARAGLIVATVPAILRGDGLALDRMITNLLENADAYGCDATVAMHAADGLVRIEIADRGPGLDPALMPHIFEPFVRGEPSRNRETGGNGLGLAIASRIAQRHGGAIAATNREGGGAVFTVTLPLT